MSICEICVLEAPAPSTPKQSIQPQTKLRIQTASIMSFVKKYTDLFPEGIWNCLFPEGSQALQEISCYRSLQEINCIFLMKTHDIRFIMYIYLIKYILIVIK